MANIPKTMSELLEWAPDHAQRWLEHAAELGLSPEAAQRFVDEVAAFQQRKEESIAAHRAAETATAALNSQEQAVRDLAGGLIRQIKARAVAVGDPSLILLAALRPDSAPSKLPAPLPPTSYSWSMDSLGELTLRWKARQPRGVQNVSYNVRRSIDGGPFALLDTVGGQKHYTDTAIPAGARTVTYRVEPIRGGVRGQSSQPFTIRFGNADAASPNLARAA